MNMKVKEHEKQIIYELEFIKYHELQENSEILK